jgi:hypothetical protein
MVKENVKATLSENKQVISVSFAALLQTLKSDPKMIHIIYNIPGANNGEQCKDDNDNITNSLEFNKDSLLDLAQKHYEDLVEALTNDAIVNIAKCVFIQFHIIIIFIFIIPIPKPI